MSIDPRIEKVARAMCRALGMAEDHDSRSASAPLGETGAPPADPPWKGFEREARLAIAAHEALQGKPPRRVLPRSER